MKNHVEKANELEFRSRCATRNLRVHAASCSVSQFLASPIRSRKFPRQRAVRIPRLAPIVPDKRTTRRNERTQSRFLDEIRDTLPSQLRLFLPFWSTVYSSRIKREIEGYHRPGKICSSPRLETFFLRIRATIIFWPIFVIIRQQLACEWI